MEQISSEDLVELVYVFSVTSLTSDEHNRLIAIVQAANRTDLFTSSPRQTKEQILAMLEKKYKVRRG